MNEITAAIKKKAEEKYPRGSGTKFNLEIGLVQNAYTCGGEDAIGFMLKFVEWVGSLHTYIPNGTEGEKWKDNLLRRYYTTEQLLLKYMEDNKL